jgi:dipeptidyl aminopeptidase/acylaminoacyl peptidase
MKSSRSLVLFSIFILISVFNSNITLAKSDKSDAWKERFRIKGMFAPMVAKGNPQVGMVVSNVQTDTFQLYKWDVASGEIKPVTNDPAGFYGGGFISADGKHIFYLQDEGGNEIGQIYAVPIDGGEPFCITPDATPFTLRGTDVSKDGRLIALNPINQDGFQIMLIDCLADGTFGKPRIIFKDQYETWLCLLSADGKYVAAQSTAQAKGMRKYSAIVLETDSGDKVAELSDGVDASIEPITFIPVNGDYRIVATTTKSGFRKPMIWNPITGERTDLSFPELEGDVRPVDWSPDGSKILLSNLNRAIQNLYIYRVDDGSLVKLQHPPGSFGPYGGEWGGVGYFVSNDEIFVNWEDAANPTTLISLNANTGERIRTVLETSKVPEGKPFKSVTFKSSDGTEIQGWLGLPDGEGPFPTLLSVHGGPAVATTDSFDPGAQAFMDNGFAILSINYRGSATFGVAFREKIWGDIGHWELVDMIAARQWLIDSKIAEPDKIILAGGSYGGYLTLWGLTQAPDLWAGGIAYVAIADWKMSYEDASDALKAAMGGWFTTTPDKDPEKFRKSSPLTYIENLKKPLIIFQGENDSRTPARQMRAFIEQAQKLGKPVEIYWYDAGHGGMDTELSIEYQEKSMEFAKKLTE